MNLCVCKQETGHNKFDRKDLFSTIKFEMYM